MTTIVIQLFGNHVTAEFSGHAGYNPGQDIVCACASGLAYTLYQRLKELGSGTTTSCTTGDGHMRLSATANDRDKQSMREATLTVCAGLRLLAKTYPQHVTVTLKQGEMRSV